MRPRTAARSLLALCLAFASARSVVHSENLTFRPSQFTLVTAEQAGFGNPRGQSTSGQSPDLLAGYEVVLGERMDVSDEPGAPQLPVEPVVIALPGYQNVTAVTFEIGFWQSLPGTHNVLPAQRQQVLIAGTDLGRKSEFKLQNANVKMTGEDGSGFTHPNPAIYESHSAYPSMPVRWTGTSYRHDSTFVQVLVYPVRYIGAEGRIEVCRKVKVEVEVQPRSGVSRQSAEGRSYSSSQPFPVRGEGERSAGEEAFGSFEYVIVTGAEMATAFQRLADWKTQKGVPAVVRTMDWVYANYTGRDQPEQLRNYLKTLADSGVKYVLLGGDVGVVPFRKAFAMASEWGADPREDSLPCDLYFADLDGSWDANSNNVFGEVSDSIDLYADFSVGRAPVNDVPQASTFVRKVLDYEHATVPGYQNKGLFFAEVLWQNPYTDMGVHKNKIERQSFASGYSLTKLYQSLGNETRSSVMQAMRENQNFLNHDGHGWVDVMQCGGSANRMRTADADTITNAGPGVLYSIGCWTTAFDFTSIGEAFVTNPNGGTVATIGNSSYGWGSPGNPGFGYSDKYDSRFWQAITGEGLYRVGDALSAAKEHYAPFSRDQNVYRWHQYTVNLMGDPEMPVWTAQPQHLDLTGPTAVGIGSGRYQFWVTSAGAPVPGALVCLAKPGEVYSRGRTDGAGRVWLDAEPRTPGRLDLTATAHNFVPYEGSIGCDSGDYVDLADWHIDDRAGNGDGVANPGETLALSLLLRNSGNAVSCPVIIRLNTVDTRVTLLDSEATAPDLEPGDSVRVDSGFRVVVAAAAQDGAALKFRLDLFGCFVIRTFVPVIQVGVPAIGLDRTWLCAPPLLPGATRGLSVRLENQGYGYGHSTWCRLVSLDGLVTVVKDSAWYGEVGPLSYASSSESFELAASGACPPGHVALMELQANADGFTRRDTFELLVGEYGFSDNMESGEAKWSHAGAGDLWHLTSFRAHSGAHAWYCGNEGSRLYDNRMDASLMTAPFFVPQGCTLRFWRWFKTPNYGVDGIRVIVMREGSEETLDFLGTGGALGKKCSSGPVVQWSSEEHELRKSATRPLDHSTARPRSPGPVSPLSSSNEPESGNSVTRPLDHLTTRPLVNESRWVEEKYDLSWLGVGEQIGLRLAFVSDGDTVDEGFYIDDVSVTGGGPPVTVAGVEAAPGLFPGLDVWPNPFLHRTQIRYGAGGELPRLSIYGAEGRVVRRLPAARIAVWDGSDDHGRRLPAGTYFIEARTQSGRRIAKVLLAR